MSPPLSGMLGRGSWSKLTCIASRGPATGTDPDGVVLNKVVLKSIIILIPLTCGTGGCETPPDLAAVAPLELILLQPEGVASPVAA